MSFFQKLKKIFKNNKKTKKNKNDEVKINYETNKRDNKIYIKNEKHLICDDANANRLVLKKYLTLFGYNSDEAENGQDALDKVMENGRYNIIWMDIKMPKMDGFDATAKLRNELNYQGIIIGLTGYVDEMTVKKCYNLGMDHVVAKPFDKNIIQSYCEKY